MVNEQIDRNLFRSQVGRRRRQLPETEDPPLSYENFTFTAEQIELCGDDNACLFDFAITGRREVAEITLESGNNFTDAVETLRKL